MATKTFGSLNGQTWDTGANWTPSWVPGPTDDTLINGTVAGIYTMTMDGAAAAPVIVKALPLAGIVLTTSSAFTVIPADTTGMTGGGQPFDNLQPSLAVTEVVTQTGIFPSPDGGSVSGDMLGFVYDFAGNFAPAGSALAQGQLLSIAANTALYSLIGTTYGGNGQNTFALPNLQGSALVGVGTGPGLSTQILGAATGSATVTLSVSQIPPHDHTLPGGGVTGATGGGQPFSNMQPSLPVERLIATSGVYPSQGGGSGSATFIGQVASFAGNFVPQGWAAAAGQVIPIVSNEVLFNIIGTTFGGDGITTFALPDLRGRVSVGADATDPLGTTFGVESTTLTVGQLPAHDHTVPGGGVTGDTGGGVPVTNDQPSLALNYLIATSGIFPSQGSGSSFDPNTPILGQITEFAGNFAPSGWALANGQLLSINTNQALFSLIGTQYGGNGTTTFALPDLRGRTLIGTGSNAGVSYFTGMTDGTDTTTLTVANLPPHDHVLCFVAGTRIATPSGPVAVEALREGDVVVTVSGGRQSIQWIGYRHVDCRHHRNSDRVWPIRIAPHAFGEGRPNRKLLLSPDHSVFVEDVLIPIKFLVNDTTVAQIEVEHVSYYHIELPRHDVVLAEGMPAESYLETGGRSAFENAGGAVQLHPNFEPDPARVAMVWESLGYAPLLGDAGQFERARAKFAWQAGMLASTAAWRRRGALSGRR